MKQLAKDDSIIISKADKGNVIVMQDKVDYTNKLYKLIFKLKTIMIVFNNSMHRIIYKFIILLKLKRFIL